MHNILCEPTQPARHLANRRGSTVIAVLLLAFGVGASTAAFTLVNGVMPHSAPFVTCETTFVYSSDVPVLPTLTAPDAGEVKERISDAYQTSYEAAGDAVDSWSNSADDFGDAGGRVLSVLLAAGALALLVACTRLAARALAATRASTLFVGVALCALPVAALLASAFGFPALGFRAVAFAVTVSLVAAYSARLEQKSRVRSLSAGKGR